MAKKDRQRAERVIEAALHSNATELDLGGLALTELPDSLGQLTRLKSLSLSSNRLTQLPQWLGQLTRLESLNLTTNQLRLLPEALGELTALPPITSPNMNGH